MCCCDVVFFKQKTAYEMRISDWSSDVCSSDLAHAGVRAVTTIADDKLHVSEAAPVVEGVLAYLSRAALEALEAVRGLPFKTRHSPKIGRASCRERVCQYV